VTIILDSSAPSPRCFPRLTGPAAAWRLPDYIHFLRNALDYLPRKVADDCLAELRWLYDRRNAESLKILDFLSVPISSLRFSGIMQTRSYPNVYGQRKAIPHRLCKQLIVHQEG